MHTAKLTARNPADLLETQSMKAIGKLNKVIYYPRKVGGTAPHKRKHGD